MGEPAGDVYGFAQSQEQVVGQGGIARRAGAGVEGDPAGCGVVGGEGAVREGGVVPGVEDERQAGWMVVGGFMRGG